MADNNMNTNFQEVEKKSVNSKNAVSILNMYCLKEKIELPSYSDEIKEDKLFVSTCSLNEFTGVGKGKKKKLAKESAADCVARHFNVYEYFESLTRNKEEREKLKNPIQTLDEITNRMKSKVVCCEEKLFPGNKTMNYVVTIELDGEICRSSPHPSKKSAKADAARLMLAAIKNPSGTGKRSREEDEELGGNESSDDNLVVDLSSDDDTPESGVKSKRVKIEVVDLTLD